MICDRDTAFISNIESSLKEHFKNVDDIRYSNQIKVLDAFREYRLSETDFISSSGYGYSDHGREKLEKVYARVFMTQDALVRHQIVSGTHAISIALKSLLSSSDLLLSIYGEPYDTLHEVIAHLENKGVFYDHIPVFPEDEYESNLIEKLKSGPKVCLIQRSRGYSIRPSLTVDKIENLIKLIRRFSKESIIITDNCYGEFTHTKEPSEVGSDLTIGSLIKNPGGGIALCGGYITGEKKYIEKCEYEMTCPGLGRKLGATLGQTRNMFLGLFFAPHVVSESLKGAFFTCEMAKNLGYKVYPDNNQDRADIVQAIEFGSEKKLVEFCRSIQKYSPVDSYLTLIPWDMPGYSDKIIMASGSFTQGSSIELSCDAPIREPYIAYIQGGLFYDHIKYAVINAFKDISDKDLSYCDK